MQKQRKKTEIQHDSDEHQGIQIECSQTESVFFFFFLCQLFVQKPLMRRAKLKAEQGKIPFQESHIIYKASHVPSSQQVPFRLGVFLFPAEEIHFLLVFYTVVFAPLIKTAERSAVSTAAFTGFGGRVRLVLCNIIFMFILFLFSGRLRTGCQLADRW